MLRSYRSIVVATCWLILAASPEQHPGPAAQSQSEKAVVQSLNEIAASLKEASHPPQADAGCKQGADNRQSDLCAQWKAADAAKESADWTRRAYWLALVGALTGALTLLAAGAAAWYAREAARHTDRAANIAHDAYRPWIFIKNISVNPQDWRVRGERFEWVFQLENKGASTAIIEAVEARLCLTNGIPSEPVSDEGSALGDAFRRRRFMDEIMQIAQVADIEASASSGALMFSGGTILTRQEPVPAEWKARNDEIYRHTIPVPGFLAWWLQGEVRYRDMRNRECKTAFCFKCDMGFGLMSEEGGTAYNYRN